MPSDAYASGLALYAQFEAGVPISHTVYQNGLKYLLGTQASDGTWHVGGLSAKQILQASDGTWHVKTRSLPFQPYFESGYPYGHDQWISAAGTAYATMALAAAVEPSRTARR